MKRTIVIYAFFTALLIVAIKYFELSLFAGQVSLKLYITLIGLLFLAIGAYLALKLRRARVEKEIVVHYVDREVERVVEVVSAPAAVEPAARPATAEEPGVAENDLLSARESEVLLYIAKGLTNREIAGALFVSENTIKTHINNIYSKLGVRRRTQALSRAKELKILR